MNCRPHLFQPYVCVFLATTQALIFILSEFTVLASVSSFHSLNSPAFLRIVLSACLVTSCFLWGRSLVVNSRGHQNGYRNGIKKTPLRTWLMWKSLGLCGLSDLLDDMDISKPDQVCVANMSVEWARHMCTQNFSRLLKQPRCEL